MRSFSLVFILGCCTVFAQTQMKEHRLSMPRDAAIHIGASGTDTPDQHSEGCLTSPPTEKQIRWRFQKFSILDDYSEAKHQDYDHFRHCWTNGTITLHGETYAYQVRWPDILFTNFPDGKNKLLQGGGEGDDPPVRATRPKMIRYPLPPDAQINLGKSSSNTPGEDCSSFRFNAQGVRGRFRTYHVLAEGEFHDSYGVFPCRFDGYVIVHGQTYTFEARQGNLLVTSFPDGKGKMLGGPPSDPLDDTLPIKLDLDVLPTRLSNGMSRNPTAAPAK